MCFSQFALIPAKVEPLANPAGRTDGGDLLLVASNRGRVGCCPIGSVREVKYSQ